MLAEQVLELSEGGDLRSVQPEAAGDLREIAAAMRRVHRIDAIGAKFVGFRSIPAIIDDADQQLDPVALQSLQFLDVLVEASVPVDEEHLAVVARDSDTDCRR